ILGGLAPALTLLAAGLVVIFGGIMALKQFQHQWVAQVINDNQVLAKTIAAEFEARFNDRLRLLRQQALDPEWPALLGQPPDASTQDRLREKLQRLYQAHGEQRLRRWSIADGDGFSRSVYGRMPSGNVEADETNDQNIAWRGWFNGIEDEPASKANGNRDEAVQKAHERLLARRDGGGYTAFLSQPYRRQSKDPARELWVLSVSCVVPPQGPAAPAGVLAGQIDYREFNEAFARFESSAIFQRKVIVANERGQTMYHERLAAQTKKDETSAEVRQIDLKQKEHAFVAQVFNRPAPGGVEPAQAGKNPSPVAYKDPWYTREDNTWYFVSRTAANLANGQKLAVLVLHDKDVALAGFVDAERYALWLGFSLLGVGCAVLVGNIWLLRRMLRHEDISADA
ncbi:MAG TPA: hypothetical protein VKH44_07195, partial [Pirellulaceae bacterium]|nr:hypothetical protein [Pirellulaceae bacterium]